ncbi:MAG TPA: hypothetical protein VKY74_11615 [Chloroflexia bacterium]|nr:hypothetical protein [Chloroflexia bacterium]
MPNKPVRQSAKFKEQQYRKRMVAQSRTTGTTTAAELDGPPDETVRGDGPPAPEVSTMRFAPAGTGTATATRPAAAPRRPASMAMPSAVRTARGRITAQMQEMNLVDEMQFIRGDIQRLLILAAASFAILIVLSFLIH